MNLRFTNGAVRKSIEVPDIWELIESGLAANASCWADFFNHPDFQSRDSGSILQIQDHEGEKGPWNCCDSKVEIQGGYWEIEKEEHSDTVVIRFQLEGNPAEWRVYQTTVSEANAPVVRLTDKRGDATFDEANGTITVLRGKDTGSHSYNFSHGHYGWPEVYVESWQYADYVHVMLQISEDLVTKLQGGIEQALAAAQKAKQAAARLVLSENRGEKNPLTAMLQLSRPTDHLCAVLVRDRVVTIDEELAAVIQHLEQ